MSILSPVDDFDDLAALPGAYGLVIDLLSPLELVVGARPPARLDEGRYLYCGSAKAPGGIRARVRRHVKGAKPVRWHVDRLTNIAGVTAIIAVPGGDECRLVAAALAWPGSTVPAPGFGSSDCRHCPAHLIRATEDRTIEELAAQVAASLPAQLWRRPPVACFWSPPPIAR